MAGCEGDDDASRCLPPDQRHQPVEWPDKPADQERVRERTIVGQAAVVHRTKQVRGRVAEVDADRGIGRENDELERDERE